MSFLRAIAGALVDLLIPPRCHLCKEYIPDAGELHICKTCLLKIPMAFSPVCTVCGISFQGSGDDHPCARCMTEPPPYHSARAAMLYSDDCRKMIHDLKYNGKTLLRRPLGLIMARQLEGFVRECRPDCIVPVPLHVSRLRKRGFNQSILIGEILASKWKLPLLRQALKRTVATRPQVELSRDERLSNLKGAFAVTNPKEISGKRILLVDDVFTTGSTIAESAKALVAAGSSSVFAVTAAHANIDK